LVILLLTSQCWPCCLISRRPFPTLAVSEGPFPSPLGITFPLFPPRQVFTSIFLCTSCCLFSSRRENQISRRGGRKNGDIPANPPPPPPPTPPPPPPPPPGLFDAPLDPFLCVFQRSSFSLPSPLLNPQLFAIALGASFLFSPPSLPFSSRLFSSLCPPMSLHTLVLPPLFLEHSDVFYVLKLPCPSKLPGFYLR